MEFLDHSNFQFSEQLHAGYPTLLFNQNSQVLHIICIYARARNGLDLIHGPIISLPQTYQQKVGSMYLFSSPLIFSIIS